MKVLLVYPEFPDTFWSFKHALKFVRKKAASAAAGPADRGGDAAAEWEKRLVDLNVGKLRDAGPGVGGYVFISGMIAQRDIGARDRRALPGGGQEDRGGGAAVHRRATSSSPRLTISC